MQPKRRLSERGMSAFGRGTVRTVLLSGLSAVAIACAASFAFADPPVAGLFRADRPAEIWVLSPFAPEITRGSSRRVSSPLVGEDQGGGSRRPTRQASSDAFANLLGPRDPPPIGRSGECPSLGRAMPAPARGGGCANAIGLAEVQQGYSSSSNRVGCDPSRRGSARPRWRKACDVKRRPRGVRCTKPSWMR